jgi:hypothetical protein
MSPVRFTMPVQRICIFCGKKFCTSSPRKFFCCIDHRENFRANTRETISPQVRFFEESALEVSMGVPFSIDKINGELAERYLEKEYYSKVRI